MELSFYHKFKDTHLRLISLNGYFKAILHYFGVNLTAQIDVQTWTETGQSLIWSIGHNDQREKDQFLVVLHRCNVNSNLHISGKSNDLTFKKPNWNTLPKNKHILLGPTAVKSSAMWDPGTGKCSLSRFYSVFVASGPNFFIDLCKILLAWKLIVKRNFLIAETATKTVKTTTTKFFPWRRHYIILWTPKRYYTTIPRRGGE